ncbi:hypothetical protein H696_04063 [Fonticula alba]|uniref:Choline/carnitine acyltransferase domain-containing protein n=1 Tax=Fonticula alba TaxID=691883 RepID=A0A058Z7Z6_FONAL|nr:hypothetical protein H696_04063 [Fonticula alba]KCV69647.1 hypothetical protein H696_04063 [Fonticula alba]|eukprot:XP_009496212.1 hypothetical protein H696_04063 [Fonticula alba]
MTFWFKNSPSKWFELSERQANGQPIDMDLARLLLGPSTDGRIPPTFKHQASLPPLPVPALEKTLQRVLINAEPFGLDADGHDTAEMAALRRDVAQFLAPGGLGQRLQGLLQAHAQAIDAKAAADPAQHKSWLEDWWLQYAYLIWRTPLPTTSNWFIIFPRHPASLGTADGRVCPIARASLVIRKGAEFVELLRREHVPIDSLREQPLCMNQIRSAFANCRIPGPGSDTIRKTSVHDTNHIIIMIDGQMFRLEIFDASRKIISPLDIYKKIHSFISFAQSVRSQPAIGLLTGADRDTWTDARDHLLARDPGGLNARSLDQVETCLFLVSFDLDYTPATRGELGSRVLLSTGANHNRWCDHTLNLVVCADGEVGAACEHTPLDAPSLCHNALSYINCAEEREELLALESQGRIYATEPSTSDALAALLRWNIDETISQALATAKATVDEYTRNFRYAALETNLLGSDWLRQKRVSADGFMQLTIQLAYLRAHPLRPPAGVYESGMTRAFLHGRTDVLRSLTLASRKFCLSMLDEGATDADRLQLLEAALRRHRSLLIETVTGTAIDRHMLALRILAMELVSQGELSEVPALLAPADGSILALAGRFLLSTSNLSPAQYSIGGYAPMYSEGYGVCYGLNDHSLWISVTSNQANGDTDAFMLKHAIEQSMQDMIALIRRGTDDAGEPRTKL